MFEILYREVTTINTLARFDKKVFSSDEVERILFYTVLRYMKTFGATATLSIDSDDHIHIKPSADSDMWAVREFWIESN